MEGSVQPTEIVLRIPPRAEYLVFCRLVLTGMARVQEIDQEALGDLKLALTEACSNAIRHAYRDGSDGDVEVRYLLRPDEISIEVADQGRGFDAKIGQAHPDELSEEGMGLAIIRAVVDDLELGTGSGGRGSRLRLTKALLPESEKGR
jgi:serine/threonine-protein kinase RsbW